MARSKSTTQYKRVRVETAAPARGGSILGFLATVVILPVFLVVLLFVKLNSDQVKMKRELSRLRSEFGLRSKELANLRVEAEMYRDGGYIGRHVGKMGLDLVEPEHGQVIRMPAGTPALRGTTVSSNAVVARVVSYGAGVRGGTP